MKKIVVLIFAALTFCLGGEPKRGISAADGIEGIDEESWNPTAADYVQDGLVAMWDGIENVGWGVHDSNSLVWKDLVGGYDASAVGTPDWGDDCTILYGGSDYWAIPTTIASIAAADNLTAEVCFSANGPIDNYGLIGIGRDNSRVLWVFVSSVFYSHAAIIWQHRGSSAIRAWYNEGALGSNTYTTSLTVFNSVCNAWLDGNERFLTPDVKSGSASSVQNGYIGRIWAFRTLSGKIFSVRLYNRTLTASEIEHNTAIDKERFGL